MANIPCPSSITCPDATGPLGNFSSEANDGQTFFAISYPITGSDPLGAGPAPPPYECANCIAPIESSVSQDAANQGALNLAQQCSHPNKHLYSSNAATCSLPCPDGSLFSYSLPLGWVSAISQALADEIALNDACAGGASNQICLPAFPSTAQTGQDFSALLAPTGKGPFTITLVAGTLPPGLSLSPSANGAVIAGVPTTAGSFTFSLEATNPIGISSTRSYTMTVTATFTVYGIANWSQVICNLKDGLGGNPNPLPPSTNPAWNGLFNQHVLSPMGVNVWFFLGQSVLAGRCAADDNANYGTGDWADADCFAQLYFLGGNWQLAFLGPDCSNLWTGVLAVTDPKNPSGTYAFATGSANGLASIVVSAAPAPDPSGGPPNWTDMVWQPQGSLNVSPPANGSLVYTAAGATVKVTETNDNAPSDGFSVAGNGASSPLADEIGLLRYTGSGGSCKLVVSGSMGPLTGGFGAGIVIAQDGAVILQHAWASGDNTGTLNFTVAAGTCSKIQIGNLGALYPRVFGSVNQNGSMNTNITLTLENV